MCAHACVCVIPPHGTPICNPFHLSPSPALPLPALPCCSLVCVPPGVDAIMLGAETLRGLYPREAVQTVQLICCEVGREGVRGEGEG